MILNPPGGHSISKLDQAGAPAKASGNAKTSREFQALVLTTMVEEMLPKNADHVYGSGTAGGIWRSMMAEKIAAQLAERDVLGLDNVLNQHIERLRADAAGTGKKTGTV